MSCKQTFKLPHRTHPTLAGRALREPAAAPARQVASLFVAGRRAFDELHVLTQQPHATSRAHLPEYTFKKVNEPTRQHNKCPLAARACRGRPPAGPMRRKARLTRKRSRHDCFKRVVKKGRGSQEEGMMKPPAVSRTGSIAQAGWTNSTCADQSYTRHLAGSTLRKSIAQLTQHKKQATTQSPGSLFGPSRAGRTCTACRRAAAVVRVAVVVIAIPAASLVVNIVHRVPPHVHRRLCGHVADGRAPCPVQERVDRVDAVAIAVVRIRFLVAAARKPSAGPRILFVASATTQSWTNPACRVEPRNFFLQVLYKLIIVAAARMAQHGRCHVELLAALGKPCPELEVLTRLPQAMKRRRGRTTSESRTDAHQGGGTRHCAWWLLMVQQTARTSAKIATGRFPKYRITFRAKFVFPNECHAWLRTCTISITTPPRNTKYAASGQFTRDWETARSVMSARNDLNPLWASSATCWPQAPGKLGRIRLKMIDHVPNLASFAQWWATSAEV